jgi:hypothetical protein
MTDEESRNVVYDKAQIRTAPRPLYVGSWMFGVAVRVTRRNLSPGELK